MELITRTNGYTAKDSKGNWIGHIDVNNFASVAPYCAYDINGNRRCHCATLEEAQLHIAGLQLEFHQPGQYWQQNCYMVYRGDLDIGTVRQLDSGQWEYREKWEAWAGWASGPAGNYGRCYNVGPVQTFNTQYQAAAALCRRVTGREL